MSISLYNYKEWLPFAFILLGLVLALIAFRNKSEKQHDQQSLVLLQAFAASLHEHDLEHWKEICNGTHGKVSAPPGFYVNRLGKVVQLVGLWTAGNEDHSSIQRIAEGLEKVCADMLVSEVDIKLMWFEIGQLLEAMHGWLKSIPGVQDDQSFLDEQYPAIKKVFEKYGHRFNKWPYQDYVKR
jgi:hypothetical protein